MSEQTQSGKERPSTGGAEPPVRGIVPMMHVADVERSVAFYRLLGFEVGNRLPRDGTMHWAWLYAPQAPDWKRGPNLMVARTEGAEEATGEGVLFYLYATDLPALRSSLLASGASVSEISYPDYLPEGECCVADPDGYTLMIAQSGPTTP